MTTRSSVTARGATRRTRATTTKTTEVAGAPAALGQVLRDAVRPGLQVLFVGINPGMRSAAIGHHFAGYSNRFWPLLFDAGLVSERLRAEDDERLPEWGLGVTNLVPRATPGMDTIARAEYAAGLAVLARKVRRLRPAIVAFVGVSLYRFIFRKTGPVALGAAPERFEGARVFVVPNPSGRNANFTYAGMLEPFIALRRAARRAGRVS
jgi:TDG/mug DNA glycosylase family protein